jgi:hypothetical protein
VSGTYPNPYRGINAHLHSLLQRRSDGWRVLHNLYMWRVQMALAGQLPPGFDACLAPSMQPRVDQDPLHAVIVYEPGDGGRQRHLIQMEMLTPPTKYHPKDYLVARTRRLARGVQMIEMDFWHEAPTLFHQGLSPYAIVAANRDTTQFYCFHVDDPIPCLLLELAEGWQVLFDFNAAYHTVFSLNHHNPPPVDYHQPPLNMNSYRPLDRARIEDVMARWAGGG